MQFGEKIRALRAAAGLTQRDLAAKVGVEFSYISKIENGKLDFGDVPSESLIQRLAAALNADEFALLVAAGKIPPSIRDRFFQRPEVFQRLASLSDQQLDEFLRRTNVGTVGGT